MYIRQGALSYKTNGVFSYFRDVFYDKLPFSATGHVLLQILNLNVSHQVFVVQLQRKGEIYPWLGTIGPLEFERSWLLNPFNPSVIPPRSHGDTVKASTYFQSTISISLLLAL